MQNIIVIGVTHHNTLTMVRCLFRWFKDHSKCESLYFYDKEDMKPYRIAKRQFVMGYVNRVLHKLNLK